MTTPMPLSTDGHAVYRLAADLLLVFKPRGHREQPHTHAYAQRLHVLSGALVVERGARFDVVTSDGTLTVAADELHATEAREDTWVVARAGG